MTKFSMSFIKADYITTFGATHLTAILQTIMVNVMILSVVMLCVAVLLVGLPTWYQYGASAIRVSSRIPHPEMLDKDNRTVTNTLAYFTILSR
jgi:hypothetical protein